MRQQIAITALCLMALTACDSSDEPLAVSGQTTLPVPEIESRALPASVATDAIVLSIDYAFGGAPTVGEPLAVLLTVNASQTSDLSLTLRAQDHVVLSENTPQTIALSGVSAGDNGSAYEVVVNVEGEGRSFLNAQVSGTYEGRRLTKAISIPIYASAAIAVLQPGAQTLDDGVEVMTSVPGAAAADTSPLKP